MLANLLRGASIVSAWQKGFRIGDEVAIAATVRRRVTDDCVSVSIPSYGFPHSSFGWRPSFVMRRHALRSLGDGGRPLKP
ncbi:MAG: hypothetical protein E5V92_10365 [Mesorhizobium sp.]|nr:hypothetical protein EJ067_31130 [Mesorhizobium sp. M1D.F.Ca.ET.043.01.1.1]RWA90296.1 MAG: hypothetical protein EOQ32_18730 [Mesorhizobium sp.]RWE15354.1 MAG: hypothetical protein EOS61_09965 [Mesorhizobium sp.]TJW87285.1 MAG: hypothetical protein E5V92_10365 [Mesorhizobium sp.]